MMETGSGKKAYEKPQMSVMRINRFFMFMCSSEWPNCYSFYMFVSGSCQ